MDARAALEAISNYIDMKNHISEGRVRISEAEPAMQEIADAFGEAIK
ncbi:hypothetical protein [Glutamicibacter arilaitensis]